MLYYLILLYTKKNSHFRKFDCQIKLMKVIMNSDIVLIHKIRKIHYILYKIRK